MTSTMNFGVHARHDMQAQAPFKVGTHEVHVFFAPACSDKTVSADQVKVVSPYGGYAENDEAPTFGPDLSADDRKERAARVARESGQQKMVVAFDLDEDHTPWRSPSHKTPDTVVKVGSYEVHVHYPKGANGTSLQSHDVQFTSSDSGLMGTEDHELNGGMDADDRASKAAALFQSVKKVGSPLAVAFFVGRPGRDSMDTSATEVAHAVNKAQGTPSPKETVADAVNAKFAAPVQGFRARFRSFLDMAHA